ncbi:MAG: tRNA(Met) cytidine acetyltransferase [Candidatus Diapherotrites archaeon]|nr:tRNA(Met) cytidine acetyltransferase [Candidatus Diapherotrites archaeon]
MQKILKSLEKAKDSRHRRMVVIQGKGKEPAAVAAELFEKAKDVLGLNKVLYMAEFPQDKRDDEERYKTFTKKVSLDVERVPYAKAKSVLGRTYDALVLDAFHNFPAKDIGIAVETIRGPGLIAVLVPPLDDWINRKLFFHSQYVVTPPYTVEDCGNIYQRRIVKKWKEHPGIFILRGKKMESGKEPRVRKKKKKEIKIPKGTLLPEEIYRLAVTQDQVDAIHALEGALRPGSAYVLLANRGRGKSAALGLFLAGLLYVSAKNKLKVVVTAPSRQNVEELFKFLKKGLEALGIKKGGKYRVDYKKATVVYADPLEAVKEKGDLLVVDEAAGIYLSILKEMLPRFKSFIFSTTTHGYEGTGRLFQYRFLPMLEERLKVKMIKMEEPIRYGENDPIERWLYDVFLLDAEPAKISKKDRKEVSKKKLNFFHEDREKLFLEDEKTLREYIGIYVFAHYRNNPRDIAILADAPNQNAFTVKTDSGKVVGSLQVAEEGGLGEEHIYRMLEGELVFGNIIPDIFLKYYEFKDFAREKGYRVVRIATHPELQGMGIGSFALRHLEAYAKEKGLAWVGAGFGASLKVVKFWKKNGYVMVHVSPKRNPESGEYSTIFVKPLKKKVERFVNVANYSAKSRLVEELGNYYYYMEPEVAYELLSSGPSRRVPINLSEGELRRLKRYIEGSLFYDAASDVVSKVVRWYFLSGMEPEIPQTDALYLIEKVLKKKTWKEAAKVFKMDPLKFAKRFDRIMARIAEPIVEEYL